MNLTKSGRNTDQTISFQHKTPAAHARTTDSAHCKAAAISAAAKSDGASGVEKVKFVSPFHAWEAVLAASATAPGTVNLLPVGEYLLRTMHIS